MAAPTGFVAGGQWPPLRILLRAANDCRYGGIVKFLLAVAIGEIML